MPVAINLFAQQFGWMLVVAKDKKRDRSGSLMWLCYCRRCGGKKIVSSDCLRRGESSSCGCYHREVARETHTRHGYYQHAIHTTWRGMRDRCFNERSKYFPRYGRSRRPGLRTVGSLFRGDTPRGRSRAHQRNPEEWRNRMQPRPKSLRISG